MEEADSGARVGEGYCGFAFTNWESDRSCSPLQVDVLITIFVSGVPCARCHGRDLYTLSHLHVEISMIGVKMAGLTRSDDLLSLR